jgi:hypothetical protein
MIEDLVKKEMVVNPSVFIRIALAIELRRWERIYDLDFNTIFSDKSD